MNSFKLRLKKLNPLYSLRANITVATAGIAVLLSLSLSYWAADISRDQIEDRQGAAFARHALDTAEMLDRSMFERYREMQVAAVLSDIRSPDVSIDAKRDVLERIQGSFDAYAWVGICDDKGKGMVGTGRYLEGKDLSQRPWCHEGRDKPFVGDVHDALLLAKILPNPTNRDFYLIDVAAPVHRPDGSLLGVLCGHIFWNWAEDMLGVSKDEGAASLLLSKGGLVLAGPLQARSKLADIAPETMLAINNGKNGHVLETWEDGKTYLTGFARGSGYRDYPGLGWVTLYRQDANLAFAPARELQQRILLIGILMGLLFAWVGWFQAGRIARPIQAITRAAKKVVTGNFTYAAPTVRGEDEVAQLAGSIDQMTATLTREISERQCAEEKLRKISEAVQQAGEAVLITDRNGVIEYANPAFGDISGYAEQEIIGKTPAVLKSEKQDPAFYRDLWDTITGGEVWHGTLIDRRKDGSLYPALMSVAPIFNGDNQITHFVSIQQDMTEHKKLEEQLLQSQKMEALGTLVGGIAHDFNNMLAGITGNLFLAKQQLQAHPDAVSKLNNIEKLSHRAADMIQQLLTFARKGKAENERLNLTGFLQDISRLNEAAIPESTKVSNHFCEEKLIINGNATQLQQVVLNLLGNAQHAVVGRAAPRIDVGLERVELNDELRAAYPASSVTSYAHLSISDNGIGIKPENLSRVLEPFFTTKGVGKGTGLGLPMVYGTVQSHDGVLEIESEPEQGTVVHIYLPLLNEKSSPVEAGYRQQVIETGHGESILLADDEQTLLETTREALEQMGYHVFVAQHGKQAVEVFSEHRDEISLVILDVVMPEMGGADAAHRIRKIRPDIPVIFVTGYGREEVLAAEEESEISLVMNKPASMEMLSQHMRRLIEAAKKA